MNLIFCCKDDLTLFSEPGLLDELARRVEEAERKFQAADLDLRLKELDAAKQRQVNKCPEIKICNSHFKMKNNFPTQINKFQEKVPQIAE